LADKELKKRSNEIIKILDKEYPGVGCTLTHRDPLQLLVATILSAQCTDERVNIVTRDLFKKYRTAKDYANAPREELEQDIRPTGFYKNKAKSIISACGDIVEKHGGKVPDNMEDLTALRGIGRKTANVVLGNAFGIPGITVDTHVGRVTKRIGLTKNTDPVKVEFDLMELWPKKRWTELSHKFIHHGRQVCNSRKPRCGECAILKKCDYGKENHGK